MCNIFVTRRLFARMDDDDDFLYGSTPQPEVKFVSQQSSVSQQISYETIIQPPTNGVTAHYPSEIPSASKPSEERDSQERSESAANGEAQNADEEEEEDEEVELGDESEDEDIEIIMEPTARSIDFRQQQPAPRAPPGRAPSATYPAQPKAPQPSLTTEYTPRSRGGPPEATTPTPAQGQPQPPSAPSYGVVPPPQAQPSQPTPQPETTPPVDSGVDTSTLPPVTAPPSHPAIDPTATGIFDGRSILELDLGAMVDKPWRRPGSDISDWFNYGFDEISWEAYCYRRRDLGELANVLKTNVLNFSGMQEDQITALPPEVRQMVMTGTTAMMNTGGNPAMMGPGVMMDMSGMMPMGMDMGMGMGGPMMQVDGRGMMQDGGQGVVGVGSGTPEQVGGNVNVGVGVGMMQDGYSGQAQGAMMNMGMPGAEYGMQEQNPMGQQMYQMEAPPQPVAPVPSVGRGAAPAAYRGRAQGMARGRGFQGRGRGRGGFAGDGVPPPVPVRPASPLPPGVPTGPRNQNKYKDRDGNAPAVEGLDYGGTVKDLGGRTPSGEPEERSMSRKRRSSPGLDDSRSSKRR
ncbi:Pre-mRNA polyadenylation factor fip1 [Hypsizygus marmoreus]|uniref:Pre-mRNA polyadenylation factor fip1 n=1 Tax=Hypsizygus marmoreus TaxID=39966 RepID=A0A369K6P4_HYPMA|nr:Pre-mRNA polyadenylation factor fip1 [Hypsizygus marmoreus]